ncbi:NAD-dependent epimerase/dehydratase family protein [Patescibacteria group bacterium]|nr:MAG: NAD-dependent epimerase/dehydratase family protein [Patescibacteria group bacterium]
MPTTPIFGKKNVLVTGGAGFIGSHLCERLLKEAKVICLDNFVNSNVRNIEHLLQLPDFEFIRADINQPIDLDSFKELEKFKVKFQGVQEIYHLACPTSIKNFEEFKIETLQASSVGMCNVLELAVKHKAKLLFTSSSVVYGGRRANDKYFREEDIGLVDQLSPRACYDEGKRFGETMVETYRQTHGLDAKIARVFRTYGPRQRLFDGEMVPDFITNAIDGKDLVIYGDENFRTSLVYVSDLVDGLIKLMKAQRNIGPVNLGADSDVKIMEVAEMIVKLLGSKSKIVFEPSLLFLTELGVPDIRKAKEFLGWLPLVRLQDGLKKGIDYAQAQKTLVGIG